MGFQCRSRHARPKVSSSAHLFSYSPLYRGLRPKVAENKRSCDDGTLGNEPSKKPRKAKPYVPALRSGPYALLLGLATLDENLSSSMTKAQLIEVAQPYCDTSFTAPSDPTKAYTAWNSMKTLIQKDLVYERGRPVRKYALTEEGWEVAKRIKKTLPGTSQTVLSFGNPSVCIARTVGGSDSDRSSRRRPQSTGVILWVSPVAIAQIILFHIDLETCKAGADLQLSSPVFRGKRTPAVILLRMKQ